MALSIVRWQGEHDGYQEFDARIGSNRFYAWGIGSGVVQRDGVDLLARRSRTSPLAGPLAPDERGRVLLKVPTDAFGRDDHHLQLLSFRDQELRGPAASDILEVPWRWSPPDDRLDARRETSSMSMAAHTGPSRPTPAKSADSHRPGGGTQLSEAQFLGALGGLIQQLLPVLMQALPVVEQVGRAALPAAAAPAANPGATSAPAGTAGAAPDLGALLAALIAQVRQAQAVPVSRQSSVAMQRYSRAAIAPALLAALPALAPVLQNVLTPQTVQSLIGMADPNRLLNTTFAGLMDAARIGQEATDKLHEHLRALNPGLGDELLIPLLASMSVSGAADRSPRFRRSRVVTLELPELATVELQGYSQVIFRRGDDLTLPVTIRTPRPIRNARLQVTVKDPATQARIAERTIRVRTVADGRLPDPVVLPGTVSGRLAPGKEYLVCLRLLWPGRSGLLGATRAQLVRMIGPAVFDNVDSGGPPVRLDDVDRDRDWWHAVWDDAVEERSGRLRARLDYEYHLAPEARANRRRDTLIDLEDATVRRQEGSLRAGLDVSVAALSRLAERLGAGAFDDDTVAALADPAFRELFGRSASCLLDLHGRRRSRLAIWVWPEVKLHDVFLRVAADISPTTGQVLSFDTRPVKVPIPAIAHVVTTRSA